MATCYLFLKMERYNCHKNTAKQITDSFADNVCVVVFGMPQIGKTSVICETILQNQHFERFLIITGLSSINWKNQTGERLNLMKRTNEWKNKSNLLLFHLPTIKNINEPLLKNTIVFIDECHIGSQTSQTISNFINLIKEKNENFWNDKNVKFVEISATPDALLECTSSKIKKIIDMGYKIYAIFYDYIFSDIPPEKTIDIVIEGIKCENIIVYAGDECKENRFFEFLRSNKNFD